MATSRLNSEQFVNLVNGLKGVILVYKSTDRDGNEKETAQQFFGADYEPKDKTQDEIFRVWKNVVMTFWAVKAEEIKLREANDGIRSKLRATTPCAVIFRTEKGETVKRFDLEESVWAKIGLVPTKRTLNARHVTTRKLSTPPQKRPLMRLVSVWRCQEKRNNRYHNLPKSRQQ